MTRHSRNLNLIEAAVVDEFRSLVACSAEEALPLITAMGRSLREEGYRFDATAVMAVLYPEVVWMRLEVVMTPPG